mmetsp:Transcript_37253/g.97600  ORF Transcript_37253/g.97600 Transcript_37253/m.97600 type:complete len:94 (-) Transcript_37253:192-473(-)
MLLHYVQRDQESFAAGTFLRFSPGVVPSSGVTALAMPRALFWYFPLESSQVPGEEHKTDIAGPVEHLFRLALAVVPPSEPGEDEAPPDEAPAP